MGNTSIFDKDLNPILEIAKNDDLNTLVEYVSTKLSEDLTSMMLIRSTNLITPNTLI